MTMNPGRLYLCTDARQSQGDFAEFVDAAFSGGVDVIQLRDKTIGAGHELDLLQVLRETAERHNRLWAVNDRADIAMLSSAPVFHVGQTDLPVVSARRLLGAETIIGLSSHTPDQVDAAISAPGPDYFCVGPVWATPTKPGRAATGLDLVRHAAARTHGDPTALPWFAIGGIDLDRIGEVVDAGATRVVVVRAITDADDPADAARRLLDRLPPLS
ncbi:thiamine phosphate synthase [Subtercola vilae]|uniref:Thiamine-phosphate synthase n=1 Tax=Subtercola vilae TaxID=2056433 RepID=A0A4T2BX48_9MICO|nr:thiamine phosphate synthase [Subtercola vilae]TIH36177.1 thiamine phosphate synthase [Subtercola vilae]